VFFGGIEALKNYWAQKRSQCEIEFSNYILEFFDEDYSVMKNYKFSSENKNNAN
jgi:hypothetical protein